MSSLYTSEGWLDVPGLMPRASTFNIIVGGRGTGKTFGFLQHFRCEDPRPFLLLRRTQVQADLITNPKFSPFVALDRVRGCCTTTKKINKYIGGIYEGDPQDDGTVLAVGPPLGYTAALSSIHNVRGYSMDVDEIILDEFIPEHGERPIPDEFNTFRNAYETINRNRELEGRRPIRVWLLANSNSLGNPYFIGLRIVEQVDKMIRKGTQIWISEERSLTVINLAASPISQAKAQTALYKLTGPDEFTGMALGNEFSQESRSRQGSIPLKELTPLVAIGELQIYRHKGGRELYGSLHRSGAPEVFPTDDAGVARFRARYGWLWEWYLEDRILWQTYLPELLFRKFMGENY